jgi:DNA modification methylase
MKKAAPKSPQATVTKLGDIFNRPPGDLKPWPTNARTHPDKQLAILMASIKKFGFTAPVLIDEAGFILSGHGRTLAAKELGLATVPTRTIVGLTEAKKRAYILADNKLAELAEWDKDLLKAEIQVLIAQDFNVEVTGFTTAEIDLMLDEPAERTSKDLDGLLPEDVDETMTSRAGDLWSLGDHLLLCGDALDPLTYQMLMQGKLAQMVISDPPYNVAIDGHVSGNGKVKHREFAMASGEMSPAEFTDFLNRAISLMHRHAKNGAIAFLFMDWRHARELQDAALPLFGPQRQLCVWAKDSAGLGTFYRSQHELVFVFKKGNAPHINNFQLGQHGRFRTNVWTYPGANSFKGSEHGLPALHPTVKPASMIADAIRDCSHRKGLVLDPFAGSGTILIAAERTGRHARAIELDPQYVDVGVKRWQRVTGKEAVLTGTGESWDEVRAKRSSNKK